MSQFKPSPRQKRAEASHRLSEECRYIDEPDLNKLGALLAAGADPNIVDSNGYSALYRCIEHNHLHAAEMLLNAGAAVNFKEEFRSTPLHWATGRNNLPMLALLRRYPVNMESTDQFGHTALITAAKEGAKDAINFLIGQGANMMACTPTGESVLQWTIHRTPEALKSRCVNALLEAGAEITPQAFTTNDVVRHRYFEANRHWDLWQQSKDFSALTVQDLHYFSNIGRLENVFMAPIPPEHHAHIHHLLNELTPCLLAPLLAHCPALSRMMAAPVTLISDWSTPDRVKLMEMTR